ncbi:MAG TPA: VOC family protein [Thermoanaerobaculia bacterium]|jgi:hypothetical protein
MTTITTSTPGTFCWIELATSDAAGARAFYTALFDWSVEEQQTPQGAYYIFKNRERSAGAMYENNDLPPHWLSYVSVASADDTAAKAKELGGSVKMGPFDVMDLGRMAEINDPQGATLAIWQPKSNIGVQVRNELSSLCWNELMARDLEACKRFYPALFGWTMKESPEYTEWHLGGLPIGGMMKMHGPDEAPTVWLPYFCVADADAIAAQAQGLGAKLYAGPQDIPGVGRFALLSDPQGAFFYVIRLSM